MRSDARGAFVLVALAACRPHAVAAPPNESAPLEGPASALSGDATVGFARALAPRPFVFPADDGPHPEFRSEWWYATGLLADPNDPSGAPHFGFQITFFRQALTPTPPGDGGSPWTATQVYMAHLALSDLRSRRFAFHQRLERAAAGLAGAVAEPFAVWLDDWSLRGPNPGVGSPFPMRVHAQTDPARDGGPGVDLSLVFAASPQPPVLQGERGLSRKGPEAGNASYYYSLLRLPTTGTITFAGRAFRVLGQSWLDREWSTSALPLGVVGWDWLALTLQDGRALMVYRLRRADGSPSPESRATVISPESATAVYGPSAFSMRVDATWRSPVSGRSYPSRLVVAIPAQHIDLTVDPLLADQELRLPIRYWEGAVEARAAGALAGRGYLELTGY